MEEMKQWRQLRPPTRTTAERQTGKLQGARGLRLLVREAPVEKLAFGLGYLSGEAAWEISGARDLVGKAFRFKTFWR